MASWSSILVPSWGHLGPSWGFLGLSWGHLGAIMGHLGAILGPSWGHLGPSWGHAGPSWDHLGPSWGCLGPKCSPRAKILIFRCCRHRRNRQRQKNPGPDCQKEKAGRRRCSPAGGSIRRLPLRGRATACQTLPHKWTRPMKSRCQAIYMPKIFV